MVFGSGFPGRIGLTKTQAQISLPGDLVLPTAQLQADRAHSFAASSQDLWPDLSLLIELYTEVWERDLVLVYEEKDQVLVWKTADDSCADESCGSDDHSHGHQWQASLTAALVPGPDGQTVVHLRERYQYEGKEAGFECQVFRLALAAVTPGIWHRFSQNLPLSRPASSPQTSLTN